MNARPDSEPDPPASANGLDFAGTVRRGTFELDLAFDLEPGTVLGVLGPNGSGKTTLLRALAGLTPLHDGEIRVGGEVLDSPQHGVFVAPRDRRVGMLFQDYRLFPHLRVRENVLFGPRARGITKLRAAEQADHWIERLGLADLQRRRPSQLSGGQAQRVALARALATEPALLVLDEPLAALDTRTRLEVRTQLRRHLADFDGPVLMVSHDPIEAMVMTDELLVIENGRAVQRGTPAQVAARPLTDYVARLVGLNLYAGAREKSVVSLDSGGVLAVSAGATSGDAPATPSPTPSTASADAPGDAPVERVLVAVRPESISVFTQRPTAGSPRNVWPGTVDAIDIVGERVRLHVQGEPDALVDVTAAAVADLGLRPGSAVWLTVKATELTVYPDER